MDIPLSITIKLGTSTVPPLLVRSFVVEEVVAGIRREAVGVAGVV